MSCDDEARKPNPDDMNFLIQFLFGEDEENVRFMLLDSEFEPLNDCNDLSGMSDDKLMNAIMSIEGVLENVLYPEIEHRENSKDIKSQIDKLIEGLDINDQY
jgi:hypothetical protein